MAPKICPHCGTDVPRNAKCCPACGSDEKTGWSESAHADNLSLPDEEFDYDEFVRREFGPKKNLPHGIRPFWWLIALLVLAALVWLWLR